MERDVREDPNHRGDRLPAAPPGARSAGGRGCLASLALGILYFRRGALAKKGAAAGVPLKNPFSLTSALKFALVFGVILLLVKWAGQSFSGRGIYVVSALGGSADPDAIALSMGPFVSEGGRCAPPSPRSSSPCSPTM